MTQLNPIKISVVEIVYPDENYLEYCGLYNDTPSQECFLAWVKGDSKDPAWEGIDIGEIAQAGWNTTYEEVKS